MNKTFNEASMSITISETGIKLNKLIDCQFFNFDATDKQTK